MVERARAGDHLARHSLVEAHIGLAIVTVKNYNDDAVLANVLCKLVEAIGEFVENGRNVHTLPAFLKQTLAREAIDFVRDEKRHAARIFKGAPRTHAEKCAEGERFEMLDEILACCETSQEAEMVQLRATGMTHAEVARQMQTSPSVVHGSMKRLELRYSLKRKVTA